MNIKIKRFDKDLSLPKRQTEGAAAFDLTAREAVTIASGTVGYVPLNIAVETPPGYSKKGIDKGEWGRDHRFRLFRERR
jgi:dUTPase